METDRLPLPGPELLPAMPTVHVNLGPRSYEIMILSGSRGFLDPWITSRRKLETAFIVTDENVVQHGNSVRANLEQNNCRVGMAVLPPGEAQKSLASLSLLYDRLVGFQADRQTSLIAVGGGVIGDLAGFAAATYNRGLPLYMVPTTLLAMVDSSVGGKVGINHPRGKNLIGAFHQPRGVWIETTTLRTLPDRELRSGFAEVVKYGVILDPELFEALEHQGENWHDTEFLEYLIRRSCELKTSVVEQDEHETLGLRSILNFGHTFAHAFEAVAGYGTLLHGEAVAIGMVCAARLAHRLGWFDDVSVQRLERLLQTLRLPTVPNSSWSVDQLLTAMRHDKKNVGGQLRFILPRWIGKVEYGVSVEENEVRQLLSHLAGAHG